MLQERIYAYEDSLSVKDKGAYLKPARMCAEYFDAIGVDAPNNEEWNGFKEYYRQEYFKKNNRMPEDSTVDKDTGRAKQFIRWYAGTLQHELFTEEQTESSLNVQPAQPVRVNFMLDAPTYEILSVLALMERRTLTAIMKDAAKLYIKEHSEQAGILKEAFEQARSRV